MDSSAPSLISDLVRCNLKNALYLGYYFHQGEGERKIINFAIPISHCNSLFFAREKNIASPSGLRKIWRHYAASFRGKRKKSAREKNVTGRCALITLCTEPLPCTLQPALQGGRDASSSCPTGAAEPTMGEPGWAPIVRRPCAAQQSYANFPGILRKSQTAVGRDLYFIC